MKYIIFLFALVFCSCVTRKHNLDTISNYEDAVVLKKDYKKLSFSEEGEPSYFLTIKKNSGYNTYTIETIEVTQFEYDSVELGDTLTNDSTESTESLTINTYSAL